VDACWDDWEARESENAHIGWLHLTPLALEHLQHPPSIIFVRCMTRSKFYSDIRSASIWEVTKPYCANRHCSTVTVITMLINPLTTNDFS